VEARGRGRPPKFGRRGQFLALTLPQDVVRWLRSLHPDPAWAIVSLFDRAVRRGQTRPRPARPPVDLAQLSARRALIVVDPRTIRSVPGVAVIPVTTDRAFLAFDHGRGLADLELAILDRLDDPRVTVGERRGMTTLRQQVRAWRRSRRVRFSTRSIILVERNGKRRRER
jgi:hypothetical protein